MAIQDDNTVLCKGDLKAYHEQILPYLGGNLMLGTNVSDYYSTDEKIVGVWTDGRPIYQKTINFGSLPNSTTKTLAHSVSNIKDVINYKAGCIKSDSTTRAPLPFTDPSSIGKQIALWVDATNINIQTGTDRSNFSAFVTIQYTKTTDAANSAVSTPGCYDINRPDLWPANKEIFFGNGLYGFRATGNMPALAVGTDWTNIRALATIGTNGKTYQAGGGFETMNSNNVRAWTQLGFSRSNSFESTLVVSTAGDLQIAVKFPTGGHHSATTNKYDVWITYTK